MNEAGFAQDEGARAQDDLRARVAAALIERTDLLTADAVEVFPFIGDTLDVEYCTRLGNRLVQLIAFGVRDGRFDPRGSPVADLYRIVLERSLPVERLFTMTYLTERTVLDDLATDQSLGATSEAWPLVAQLVRRTSFDLLAAYTDRAQLEPTGAAAIIDRLTTLYTRPVLDAVLAKSVDCASRYGDRLSLILFDIDHLSAINNAQGYGVGDRILERLGILVRGYFRHYDWVARHSEDSIAVLLTRTDPNDAVDLAEKVCDTVAERLELVDHRTEQPIPLTLTAAVINVRGTYGSVIDPDRLMADAEAAIRRAKERGRNSVERVDGYSGATVHT